MPPNPYIQKFENLYNDIVKKEQERNDTTHIYFLYFLADSMKPQARRRFAKWPLGDHVYYVLQGIQKHFMYIYQDEGIKTLVKIADPSVINQDTTSNEAFDVIVLGDHTVPDAIEVLVGNHIDYGIIISRKGPVVKCHLTSYSILGDGMADRSTKDCNFMLPDPSSIHLKSLDDFEIIQCEAWPIGSCDRNTMKGLTSRWTPAVFNVTHFMLHDVLHGGKSSTKRIKYGRFYKVRQGARGGEYIVCNGKKRYIKNSKATTQQGGNDDRLALFHTEAFETLIHQVCYRELTDEAKSNIAGFKVFYDVDKTIAGETGLNGDYATIVYFFDQGSIHYVLQINMYPIFLALREMTSHKPNIITKDRLSSMSLKLSKALLAQL